MTTKTRGLSSNVLSRDWQSGRQWRGGLVVGGGAWDSGWDPEAGCLAQKHTIAPELEARRGGGDAGGHWPSPICSQLMVTGCCFASWAHR